jgi:hypothetical protein
MSGARPPLLQYDFMAWCIVKITGITLPFTLHFTFYETTLINCTGKKTNCENVECIRLAQDRAQLWSVVNTVMNLRVA